MTTDRDQSPHPTSTQNIPSGYRQAIDAPAPIICTAKCSSSAVKDIFGNIHEEIEMDVGNEHVPKEQQGQHPAPTISIEHENAKTEPINIDNGRRRPSQRSYTE